MIKFEEALDKILESIPVIDKEHIEFTSALNRVLAQDVKSDIDMPPFNKSAMDGYACRRQDLNQELEIIETIRAGKIPEKKVTKHKCARIMTGAIVPRGADCVIMVEETELTDSGKVLFVGKNTKPNFVPKAQDVKSGDIVLEKGTIIKPQHIAVLASAGCIKPLVSRKVRVGVISTGDEIVEPGQKPVLSQIRNSNGYQLMAQSERIGTAPVYYGIAGDSEELTLEMISKAVAENDIVLLTGGVSMGDFDFIPAVFEKMGIRMLFRTVAIQPGKPTVFGIYGKKRIFGLPGNPVSSFNTFELFVRPLILKMMGADHETGIINLPLGIRYTRIKSARMSWIPVKISDKGLVIPLEYHGSAHIQALVNADGIIGIPVGTPTLEKGERVDVRQI
ncbi:MAG: molybdopterin molybdotransferase MoeA [Bacteroidetes bacterium]|nr:molybdopterin molybdotransferase MoeA [Bacteroidota bacterium]